MHGVLRPDGKRCDYTGFLLYASNQTITLAHEKVKIDHGISGVAHGVEIDFKRNIIFYSTKLQNDSYVIRMFNTDEEHKDLHRGNYQLKPFI